MLVLRHLTWPLLAASLVVGVAALVRMADPTAGGADDITGVIRLPLLVTWTIAILFTLAVLVFLLDLLRRMRSRRHEEDDAGALGLEPRPSPPWLRTIAQILSLLNFLIIAYLLWQNVLPLAVLIALGQGAGSATALLPDAQADAPFFVTSTFAILALAAGTAALALALWVAFSDRLASWWEREPDDPAPSPLAEALEESLEDLRAEPDARRAIIRCYARFERAAADSGLERRPWQTPMEFMREALSRLPAPREAIRTLTGLFELARFSDRALGAEERERALDALDDIKAAIEAGRPDAVAR